MKIAIVTLLYRRLELSKLVADHFAYTFPDVRLIAVESPGDYQIKAQGWEYTTYPNANLAQKFNQAFEYARQYNPDAVILTGSSTLLSKNLIDYYQSHYSAEADYVLGLKDIYLYERTSGKMIHWHGMKGQYEGWPIGAGRIFSRAVLDKIDWRPYANLNIPRGLDTNSSIEMKARGVECKSVLMSESGIALDIKESETLNPFQAWELNGEYVENKPAFDNFPAFMLRLKPKDLTGFPAGQQVWCKILIDKFNGEPLPYRRGQVLQLEGMFAYGLFKNHILQLATSEEIVGAETVTAQLQVINNIADADKAIDGDKLLTYITEDSDVQRVYAIPKEVEFSVREQISELSPHYKEVSVRETETHREVVCKKNTM